MKEGKKDRVVDDTPIRFWAYTLDTMKKRWQRIIWDGGWSFLTAGNHYMLSKVCSGSNTAVHAYVSSFLNKKLLV